MNSTPRHPPAFVPTLTEVVEGQGGPAPVPGRQLQDDLVQRVMQRVDLLLERRVREAVATGASSSRHQDLLPQLREEIESVVRHAVYEAVADELASGQK
jgi:hypothetical protein